jgi:hypothetical protein
MACDDGETEVRHDDAMMTAKPNVPRTAYSRSRGTRNWLTLQVGKRPLRDVEHALQPTVIGLRAEQVAASCAGITWGGASTAEPAT